MKTFDELVIEGREAIANSRMTIAESNRLLQCFATQSTRLLISSAHIHVTVSEIRRRRMQDDRTQRAMAHLRERSKYFSI